MVTDYALVVEHVADFLPSVNFWEIPFFRADESGTFLLLLFLFRDMDKWWVHRLCSGVANVGAMLQVQDEGKPCHLFDLALSIYKKDFYVTQLDQILGLFC